MTGKPTEEMLENFSLLYLEPGDDGELDAFIVRSRQDKQSRVIVRAPFELFTITDNNTELTPDTVHQLWTRYCAAEMRELL